MNTFGRVFFCLVLYFTFTTFWGAVLWPGDFYADEDTPAYVLLWRKVAG